MAENEEAGGDKPSKVKSALVMTAAVLTIGATIAGLLADSISVVKEATEESELSAAVVAKQTAVVGLLAGFGDPPPPKDCLANVETQLDALIKAATPLKDGKADSKRPQDAAAVNALTEFTKAHPDQGVGFGLLAKAQLYNGVAGTEVAKNAKVADTLCDKWALPSNLVGITHFRGGRSDDAEVSYRTALGRHPAYAAPRFNLALIALRKKDAGAAVEELTTLIGHHPHHKNAHLLRGQAYLQLNKTAEALVDLKAAVAADGKNANAQLLLGQALAKSGDAAGAKKALCTAKSLGHPAGAQVCPE